MKEDLSLTTTVQLQPRRAGLEDGTPNRVHVLVRIQAPAAPAGHAAERPPQALSLVIDRSGSMAGRPLVEARRCVDRVIRRLRPSDSVSLVQFDHRVRRLWPAVPLGDGTGLRSALAGIVAGGSTDLHGGWREGAETLAGIGGRGLKRVILLSDGQANEGLTDPDAIAAECTAWAARGITTSTYGLGDKFNEDLMVAMGRGGGGNHYYGDAAEDLMEPFQQELELLGNLCLRDLRIRASVPDGAEVRMLNELPQVEGGWRLPDLAWGAEAWAVFRIHVPVVALPRPGALLSVLRVTVQGQGLHGEPVELERCGLALPVLSPAAFAAVPEDGLVARRRIELAAAEVLTRMRHAAGRGDWAAVDDLIQFACHRFAGNEWLAAMLQDMQDIARSRARDRMMKEAMYSSSRLHSRLAPLDEGALDGEPSALSSLPAYLRRKSSQGKGDC